MFKIKKLDMRGVAHHFALAVIIVGLAVFGVYRLVLSHADMCSGASGPTSGATDGVTSAPVSGSCTPTSEPAPATISCTITGVPTNPTYGQVIRPVALIVNHRSTPITPVFNETVGLSNDQGQGTGNLTQYTLPTIAPGGSATQALNPYTVPYASSSYTKGSIGASGENLFFSCGSYGFTLPAAPVAAATCNIYSVPASVHKGSSFSPFVLFKNVSTVTFTLNVNSNVQLNDSSAAYNFPFFSHAKYGPKGATFGHTLGKYTVPKTTTATGGVVMVTDPDANIGTTCNKPFKVVK